MTAPFELPRMINPAQRALAGAGIRQLNDLVRFRESDVARLRGVGPNVPAILKEAMRESNIQFANE